MSNDPQGGTSQLTPEEKKARLGRAFGVMSLMAIVGGAGAGAIFAWNVAPVVAAGVPLLPLAAGGALLGAIIAFFAFRRVFASAASSL